MKGITKKLPFKYQVVKEVQEVDRAPTRNGKKSTLPFKYRTKQLSSSSPSPSPSSSSSSSRTPKFVNPHAPRRSPRLAAKKKLKETEDAMTMTSFHQTEKEKQKQIKEMMPPPQTAKTMKTLRTLKKKRKENENTIVPYVDFIYFINVFSEMLDQDEEEDQIEFHKNLMEILPKISNSIVNFSECRNNKWLESLLNNLCINFFHNLYLKSKTTQMDVQDQNQTQIQKYIIENCDEKIKKWNFNSIDLLDNDAINNNIKNFIDTSDTDTDNVLVNNSDNVSLKKICLYLDEIIPKVKRIQNYQQASNDLLEEKALLLERIAQNCYYKSSNSKLNNDIDTVDVDILLNSLLKEFKNISSSPALSSASSSASSKKIIDHEYHSKETLKNLMFFK